MKLREIIKKIKEYSQKQPSLEKYINNEGNLTLIKTISSYIDYFLVSKSEAISWVQSLNDEIEDLRNQIDELKSEMDYQSAIDEPYAGGLSPEELELVDQMIAEEYFCKLYDEEHR